MHSAVHEWQTRAPQLCFSRAVVHHRTHQYGGRARRGALHRHCGTQIHASDTHCDTVAPCLARVAHSCVCGRMSAASMRQQCARCAGCLICACPSRQFVHHGSARVLAGASPAALAVLSCAVTVHLSENYAQQWRTSGTQGARWCTCARHMRHGGASAHGQCFAKSVMACRG